LIEEIQPEFWSEHLAFVRGGGLEIGHLAAPPRTEATIAGAVRNLAAACRIVGRRPLVENIATLIDPPASTMHEAEWTRRIVERSNCNMVLDLHNLYANAVNFHFDPLKYIDHLSPHCLRAIHIAGGRWIDACASGDRRLLDDHCHEVPDSVYELLTYVGARAPHPLTIILERDGNFPMIEILLAQLDRARSALRFGREQRRFPLTEAVA
jgi:uncharacterized protein (UPF0276 family)